MATDSTFLDRLILDLLVREGGFVDHPADRGGPTNFGITQAVLAAWRGSPVDRHDVRTMHRDEAMQIYRHQYWEKPGFHRLTLDPVVIEMIFDTAVHSGTHRAVMFLQEAVGTKEDGVLGPVTLAAATSIPQLLLASRYIAARTAFLGRLISRNKSQAVFAAGWMQRMAEFIESIAEVAPQ